MNKFMCSALVVGAFVLVPPSVASAQSSLEAVSQALANKSYATGQGADYAQAFQTAASTVLGAQQQPQQQPRSAVTAAAPQPSSAPQGFGGSPSFFGNNVSTNDRSGLSDVQRKAEAIADKAELQQLLAGNVGVDTSGLRFKEPEPQTLEELQYMRSLKKKKSKRFGLSYLMQDEKTLDTVLDMRFDAQKEAALSFGARGGLAKRSYEIMKRLETFEASLDTVFRFRALLVTAPSGLLIEPPIVHESVNSMLITAGGDEAAVADKIYDISQKARIVTAPREWRQYLLQEWVTRVPKPPRLLLPKDKAERRRWKAWVTQGWNAGTTQADETFEANLARLMADYNGMVRYRMLLAQGMITEPYAMHEDRGVTGTQTVMRVGDRALRITGPSQFMMGAELWKPADR